MGTGQERWTYEGDWLVEKISGGLLEKGEDAVRNLTGVLDTLAKAQASAPEGERPIFRSLIDIMKSTIEGGIREANSQRRMIERGTEWKQQNKDMLGQLENINGERLARDYILEPNDIRTEDFEDTTTLEEIRRILTEQLGVMSTAFDQKKQEINKRRRGVDYDEPLYKELEAQIETLRGDLGQRIGELNSFINRFTKRFFEGGYNDSTDKTEYTPWGPKTLGEAKKEISGYILEEENERKEKAENKKETDKAIKAALALARSKAE